MSSRREFIKGSLVGAAALSVPTIITKSSLFAQTPPSRKITIAQIGCGRMGMADLRGTIAHDDLCRFVAVCDLDSRRAETARREVEKFYKDKGEKAVDVKAYKDYHEILSRKDIDAVIVTPPDHWHAIVAVEAVLAGKDLHVQKPLTYDIHEAIALRKVVRAKQRILQTGSQQRSSKPWNTFRMASEAVRNGRIGQVKTVRIGVGIDEPKGQVPKPEPVPASFDYETWLGPAPQQPYMEARCHPQNDYGRPGWITTEDFGLGMITNWGAHHVDIAQWALGMELSTPTSVEGMASFMSNDVWTVHHMYHLEYAYANGVRMILDHSYPNGLRFEGTEGWVFCARTPERVTASDPNAPASGPKPLDASDERLLTAPYGTNAKRWAPSDDHYRNWLEAVQSRKDPLAPVDESARSLETCAIGWIAMKLRRKLTWDPIREQFVNDAEANALCSRKPRSGAYDLDAILKRSGLGQSSL